MQLKLDMIKKVCSVCGTLVTDGRTLFCENCNMELTKVKQVSQEWNPRLEMYTLKLTKTVRWDD